MLLGMIETKRRFILNYFCNSDLEKDAIIHFCPYSCCPSPEHTLQMFCKHVVYALIPRKCPTLSRKSWTGSDAAFDWLSLLAGFWNLHERILVKYTGFVKSVSDQPGQENIDQLVDVLEDQGQDQDDFFDDEHMADWARLVERLAPDQSAAREVPLPDSEQSRAEFNKGCRKRTGAFVTSKHVFEKLVLTSHVLQIALRMLYALLQMASAEWLKGQENVGPERMLRILETAKGTFIRKSMEEVPNSCCLVPWLFHSTHMFGGQGHFCSDFSVFTHAMWNFSWGGRTKAFHSNCFGYSVGKPATRCMF